MRQRLVEKKIGASRFLVCFTWRRESASFNLDSISCRLGDDLSTASRSLLRSRRGTEGELDMGTASEMSTSKATGAELCTNNMWSAVAAAGGGGGGGLRSILGAAAAISRQTESEWRWRERFEREEQF
jgi:hypothetical protein